MVHVQILISSFSCSSCSLLPTGCWPLLCSPVGLSLSTQPWGKYCHLPHLPSLRAFAFTCSWKHTPSSSQFQTVPLGFPFSIIKDWALFPPFLFPTVAGSPLSQPFFVFTLGDLNIKVRKSFEYPGLRVSYPSSQFIMHFFILATHSFGQNIVSIITNNNSTTLQILISSIDHHFLTFLLISSKQLNSNKSLG